MNNMTFLIKINDTNVIKYMEMVFKKLSLQQIAVTVTLSPFRLSVEWLMPLGVAIASLKQQMTIYSAGKCPRDI